VDGETLEVKEDRDRCLHCLVFYGFPHELGVFVRHFSPFFGYFKVNYLLNNFVSPAHELDTVGLKSVHFCLGACVQNGPS
jgi:hypothetical protein